MTGINIVRSIGEDMEKPLIFVSCGQYTREEAELGTAISEFIARETPYEPYFAEEQNTLEGLVTNILGALDRAAGLIAVIHNRGTVTTPKGALERGSVWIEQEIAIAAFIQHVLKRNIEVALYAQEGIALEGIRQQLRLKLMSFKTASDILTDLPERLRSWQLEGRRKVSLTIVPRHIDTGRPSFVIGIANENEQSVRAPYLALKLPSPFRVDYYGVDGNGNHGLPLLPQAPQEISNPKFGDATTVIHPQSVLEVTRIEFRGNLELKPKSVEVPFEVTAEGAEQTSDVLTVNF